jgi:hypothetical protein
VVERLGTLRLRQPKKLGSSGCFEPEMMHERAFDVFPLLSAELAVGVSQFKQQRAGRELDPIGGGGRARNGWRLRAADEPLPDEMADAFKHLFSRPSWCHSGRSYVVGLTTCKSAANDA